MIAHSQLAPLPSELPFRIISKTIGQGAYACIKKATPLTTSTPVFAVKFIHKAFAIRHGRLTTKQLHLEITLHSSLAQHPHIIQFYHTGEDPTWRWIAMELASGGDLFDKIESDVGVGEDVAHLYFTQLVSAVAYMHSKGVGHRDIKPENILLDAEGNLKIADFGLATLFEYKGVKKLCKTSCGSPPYTAPEVVTCDPILAKKNASGYYGDLVDIWSCGVVLFVLLVGNTPWDEPLERSYEFSEYVRTKGRPDDELWHNLPSETVSLLRGMMRVDPSNRFSLADIRRHPWFTRRNRYLGPDGRLQNPIALATQMFESMRIDFSQDPMASSQRSRPEAMDIDIVGQDHDWKTRIASTQPITPVNDIMFDWEKTPRMLGNAGFSASQPTTLDTTSITSANWDNRLASEPSLSQFSSTPSVPLTLTQHARQFHDIIPSHPLTRFYSLWSLPALLPVLTDALHRLGVPVPTPQLGASEERTWIKIRTTDGRNCPLSGDLVVETLGGNEEGLCEVGFVKVKGDPVEWRRFFKRVVLLCRDVVFKPEE